MENSSDFKIVRVHLNRNRHNKIRCYPVHITVATV
jgi:hypothetical protein